MRDLAILFIHLIATIAKLMRPDGARAIVAESLLVKHQLVILNRGRERAPNLRPIDRVIAGLCTLFIRPDRLLRVAVVLRPSTVLAFHAPLVKRKYRLLFSPKTTGKPGPKGPSPELVAAIVETKRRNPSWGCRRRNLRAVYYGGLELTYLKVRFWPKADCRFHDFGSVSMTALEESGHYTAVSATLKITPNIYRSE